MQVSDKGQTRIGISDSLPPILNKIDSKAAFESTSK